MSYSVELIERLVGSCSAVKQSTADYLKQRLLAIVETRVDSLYFVDSCYRTDQGHPVLAFTMHNDKGPLGWYGFKVI